MCWMLPSKVLIAFGCCPALTQSSQSDMLTFTPIYRLANSNDAGSYLSFLQKLDAESPFMHYVQGERTMTEQGMRSRMNKQEKQGNCFVVLSLGIDELPIGYFSV